MKTPSPDAAPPPRPLVLFDGVCNLCNAAVQWLIERDPEGRFRLASLQSEAARAALAGAGVSDPSSLPDSIVLVDDAGVHVRSAAALRIAGGLGFPYRFARAALVVPAPVRDGVYRLIARNRYRWFGRRDTCMRPTPEVAARFLDAGEPVRVVPNREKVPVDPGERPGTGSAAWVKSWLTRLAVIYVVLYMLPFPLSLLGYVSRLPLAGSIPGISAVMSWLVGLHGDVMTPLTTWVGDRVFGVTATLENTGSGDQTFNYVQIVVTAVLALVVSAAWTAGTRARKISPTVLDAVHVVARFYLATTLLTYGWFKIFPLQFPLPGPDRLIQPYGDSSPMGLAWTFLGASAAYQIFAGCAELIGGYLLFWRRTALLGALFAAAVLTNVVAINFFYDVPVKLFSFHLLLVAVYIMAPDLPRLAGLFGFNLPVVPRVHQPFWATMVKRRWVVIVAHLALVGIITVFHVSDGLTAARSFGYLRDVSPLAGVYRIESFERAGLTDRENADTDRWVRVGLNPPSAVTIQRASGDAVRMRLALDENAGTLSIYDRGAQPPEDPAFRFTRVGAGVVHLEGIFEGAETTVTMRKSDTPSFLVERGYHWINEFPFNR